MLSDVTEDLSGLLKASRAFLDKVRLCTEHDSYKTMQSMAWLHGWRHFGPDWVQERETLTKLLERLEAGK